MKEMAITVSFPVIFYDGEREIDIGNIDVHPSLEFKKFQSILSQKIGISPHQISVSLICRKKSKSSGGPRKVPINEKVNFSTLVLMKDCYFLAVLKRSRREIKGNKSRQNKLFVEEEDYLSSTPIKIPQNEFSISPPPKMLLRRDQVITPSQFGLVSPYYEPITSSESFYKALELLEFENQFRNLQIQKENYLMSSNSHPYTEMDDDYVFRRISDRIPKNLIVCEECSVANVNPTPFHWCIYDTITVGFRSPAGPIARPSKISST